MQRQAEARQEAWFLFARRDLGDGALLLEHGGSTNGVCWLAQQAAEKALKGLLVARGQGFPYSHDLDLLARLIERPGLPSALVSLLPQLSRWAFTTRYPGVWNSPTTTDAAGAIEDARVIIAASADIAERAP